MPGPNSQNEIELALDNALAEYMKRADAGQPIDEREFIFRHPELADELRAYFDDITAIGSIGHTRRIDHAPNPLASKTICIRCPHCRARMEVLVDSDFTRINCDSCDSHFSLANDDKSVQQASALSTIGHFEFVERLGIGSFGAVWKARDTELGRFVAVKIPRRNSANSKEGEAFLREARAAAQLKHPNIVAVHEVGREDDTQYIVSDLVQGVTLSVWMDQRQPSVSESVELIRKIALAVHYAHEQDIVHRDLKPGNILMDRDSEPHVTDFGLARRQAADITMTADGHILGTPAYMSPEQAAGRGHSADRRSDVYSLGVILFQLLTGEWPFRGSYDVLIYQVQFDDPPSPRILNRRLPKDLETICLKCLQKDPGKRYQGAQELADDLSRYLEHRPIKARPTGRLEKAWQFCKRKPALATAIVMSTILAIGGPVMAVQQYALRSKNEWLRGLRAEERQDYLSLIDETRINLSGYYSGTGEKRTRNSLLKTTEEYRKLLAQKPDDAEIKRKLAKTLLMLSDVSRSESQLKRAIAEAVEARESIKPDTQEVVDVQDLEVLILCWDKIALASEQSEKIVAYQRAYNLIRDLADSPMNAQMNYEAGRIVFNFGLELSSRNRDEAIQLLKESIDFLNQVPDESEYDQQAKAMRAYTNELLGEIFKFSESPKKSLVRFETAVNLRKELVDQAPQDPKRLENLAEVYNKLAGTQQILKANHDALHSLKQSIKHREKVLARILQNDEISKSLNLLVGSYDNASRSVMSADSAKSLLEGLKGIKVFGDLEFAGGLDRLTPDTRYRFATAFFNYGERLKANGDSVNALACFDLTVQLLQQLVDSGVEPDRSGDLADAKSQRSLLLKALEKALEKE